MLALTLLYVSSIMMILKMVYWDQILVSKSPFISALSEFHLPYLGSIFNVIIISAAFSTFVGALFAITNVLLSLVKDHEAPKIVLKKDKRGVNVIALLIGTSGLFITIILSIVLPNTIYEYLATSAGVLLISNWIIILASQIKNRKNYSINRTSAEKPFKMLFAPYSSYLGIFLIVLTLIGVTFDPTNRIGLFVGIGIVVIIYLSSLKAISKKITNQ